MSVAETTASDRMDIWAQLQAQPDGAFTMLVVEYQQLNNLDHDWILDRFL
jgi:hypothetical protein